MDVFGCIGAHVSLHSVLRMKSDVVPPTERH
ncbi:hypothetical protein BRAO285_850070 [Bradyrhizobium sp. ORS 285]|nr:hypothetical protein BRAO285_850070 [Bradyrhizobium sp. ORS 285]